MKCQRGQKKCQKQARSRTGRLEQTTHQGGAATVTYLGPSDNNTNTRISHQNLIENRLENARTETHQTQNNKKYIYIKKKKRVNEVSHPKLSTAVNTPGNFYGGKVSDYLQIVWSSITTGQWILQQMTGMCLKFVNDPSEIKYRKELNFSGTEL